MENLSRDRSGRNKRPFGKFSIRTGRAQIAHVPLLFAACRSARLADLYAEGTDRFLGLLDIWTFVSDGGKPILRRTDLRDVTNARLDIRKASGYDLSALDVASYWINGAGSFANFENSLVCNLPGPRLLFRARALELLRRREEEKLDSDRLLPDLRSNGVR